MFADNVTKFRNCILFTLLIIFQASYVYWNYNITDLSWMSNLVVTNKKDKNNSTSFVGATKRKDGDDDEKNFGKDDYKPAPIEQWIMKNLHNLGWDENTTNPDSCSIFHNQTYEIYPLLHQYITDLNNYHTLIDKFPGINITKDLRSLPKDKCHLVRLDTERGLEEMFHNQLSKTVKGFIEPLSTPMRHPMFCFRRKRLMDMKYMVHDFEAICHEMKPFSRTVLIDMGASLDFHQSGVPIFYLLGLYVKFGIHFDHIYGFEAKLKEPASVYTAIPEKLMASYHWINVGVSPNQGDKLNPLHSILQKFKRDGKELYIQC